MKAMKRTKSLVAIAVGLCLAGSVMAQSTTGNLYGTVPAGTVVVIVGDTGITRTVTAGADGRYSVANLPAGNYKIEAKGIGTREVTVTVGGGTDASFVTNLETVTVTGSRGVSIDISQTDTRTVFTADVLSKIAVGQSVNQVALLAPGVINSTSYNKVNTNSTSNNNNPLGRAGQNNIGSFGGTSASENAYYINGFPVTNPLTALGATSLGFDSMAQVQVLTGGYGAEFGRSTGGVVSVITKKGTNEWKGGLYTIWSPSSLKSTPKSLYFANTGNWNQANHPNSTFGNNAANWTDGTLYRYLGKDKSEETSYGAYVSGPIIKDRLFFYANIERNQTEYEGANPIQNRYGASTNADLAAQQWREGKNTQPRFTGKLDWNITDNHILEFTAVQDDAKEKWGDFGFDNTTLTPGTVKYQGGDNTRADTSRLYIAKYTGYLTDDLTISALVGDQKIKHGAWNKPGYDGTKTFVSIANNVIPTQYAGTLSPSKVASIAAAGEDETKAARFDVSYRLGKHDLRAGYDYTKAQSYVGGSAYGGPGFIWTYGLAGAPNENIAGLGNSTSSNAGTFAQQGYYVSKDLSSTGGKASTEQKAWYLEDRWQLNKEVLLSLGIRNDSFTNFNLEDKAFLTMKNIWQPRVGAVWDVKGDAKLKVFANAGRYALSVPSNVAIRAANGTLSAQTYYTYTGINADGTPSGLTAITPGSGASLCASGTPGAGGVSLNQECGTALPVNTIASKDLKPHYQDEYIIGMEQSLAKELTWGAKFTYRDLKSAMDDVCLYASGDGDPANFACRIFNPGRGISIDVPNGSGGFTNYSYTNAQLGNFPKLKRKYVALDLFAEYQDGRLYGKIEYTWSRVRGNAEGQLNSTIDTGTGGQADVSVTADWDHPQQMEYADGLLPTDRTHQIKAFGSYKLTDEWRVGGSAIVQSGMPRSCTGFYPYAFSADTTKGLYDEYGNGYYHFCGVPGAQTSADNPAVTPNAGYGPSPRGTLGRTPWTKTFNVSVNYSPSWSKGLSLTADVLNVFNTQTESAYYSISTRTRSEPNQSYGRALYYTNPRSVRFTARYDF